VGPPLRPRAAARPTIKAPAPAPLPTPTRTLDGLLVSGEPIEVLDRLVTFLERTSDLVGVTDDKGNIVYLNRSARARLGVREDSDEPLTTEELFPHEAFDIYFDQIRPRILGGDVWTGYLPIRGAVEPIEMWATVVGEARPGGEVAWMVLAARDVNDWRYAPEGHQRHQAYDDLTGLASRSLLLDHLAKAQTRAARTGNAVAIAFIDIDDMKMVNHTFGNRFGDAVIVEVAHRLRDAVRVIDTVARVGGDQFVVLFDGVADEDETVALITQIQATLESAAVEIDGRSINVSASIGTAMARDGELGDQLLGRADTAMYEVKADRRQQHGRPSPTIGPELRSVTLKDLAVAVTRRDIVPYFQRVVDVATGETRGMQALARWLRPDGTAVDAGQFLGIADDSGVSFSLDLAMLRHAAAELAPHPELGRLYLPVSPRFLRHAGVDRFVHEVLAHAELPPDRLAILVHEQLLSAQTLVIGDAMATLHQLGVDLVLDTRPARHEPGPNGTSAAATASVPASEARSHDLASMIAEVRLGPAWMGELERDPDALAEVVRGAQARGQRVLAGGVETDQQREALRALGCHLLSGHLIGEPKANPAA
jgi:diguanylate cyclase (GGDEF)-like protein